jgi:23S rRNA (adenine2503-C2)-methyltransferase
MQSVLLDYSLESFEQWCQTRGHKTYRARQVFEWIYRCLEFDISGMTNLPAGLRKTLSAGFTVLGTTLKERHIDSDQTVRFLFELRDGHGIETVYIPGDDGYTLCISSQVGCVLGCRFCATGAMGIIRNLTSGEIISQVLNVRHLTECDFHGNIVFMGMGEPLLNSGAVIDAIWRMTNTDCMGWSPRRITVSTAGIVPEIKRLGDAKTGVNLAVSFNAPDDITRSRLMPINKKYPLKQLMAALDAYPLPSRQHHITCEYVMIRGINDTPSHADKLIRLLNRRRFKINLIPFNSVSSGRFRCSEPETILEFQRRLKGVGFTVHIRNSRGSGIHAACGQLAGSAHQSQH